MKSIAVVPRAGFFNTRSALRRRAWRRRFTFSILSSPDELERERDCWTEIVEESCDGNPLLSLDWHQLWLKHFAHQRTMVPYYIRVTHRGSPIAYFPLATVRTTFHRLSCKALVFTSRGQGIAAPIIAKDNAQAAANYFIREILPRTKSDLLIGRDLPCHYPGSSELADAAKEAGHGVIVENANVNWLYEVSADKGCNFLESRSGSMRRELGRHERRLNERGALEFRVVKDAPRNEDIEMYREIFSRSWKRAEKDQEFYFNFMARAAERGWLRLGFLLVEGAPIAVNVWLVNRGQGCWLKTAYDEDYRKFGPGNLLACRMIERLKVEDGCMLFDFLRGDESYKHSLGNHMRRRTDLVIFQKNQLGRIAHFTDRFLLPQMRRVSLLRKMEEIILHRQ